MRRSNVLKNFLGFTLIEVLVIILIVGTLSTIAIPSFISVFDKFNLNTAVVEVRAVLQQGQRQAILKSQVCRVGLDTLDGKVLSYCSSDERKLPDKIAFATNIVKNYTLPNAPVIIEFGVLGTAKFAIEDLAQNGAVNPPKDPSGKIVFYIASNSNLSKKCIAISNILGLTRVGNYTGKIIGNSKLSNTGVCTAA